MADRGGEFSFFRWIYVSIDKRIDIAIAIRPLTTKVYNLTWPFDHVVSQDHVTGLSHYIFTITMPMATKLCMMVTYLERRPPITSHDHIITERGKGWNIQ